MAKVIKGYYKDGVYYQYGKLYGETGEGTDGAMTQKAVTNEFKPIKVDESVLSNDILNSGFFSKWNKKGYKTSTISVGSDLDDVAMVTLNSGYTVRVPISPEATTITFKDYNSATYGSIITDSNNIVLATYYNKGAAKLTVDVPTGAAYLYYVIFTNQQSSFDFKSTRNKVAIAGLYEIPFKDFRYGSIDNDTPIESTDLKFLLSLYLLKYDEIERIKFNEGYQVRVLFLNNSNERVGFVTGDIGMNDVKVECPNAAYIRLLVRKVDGTVISPTDEHGVTLISKTQFPTLSDKRLRGVDYLTLANSSFMPLNMPERDFGTATSQGKPYTKSTSLTTKLDKEVAKDMTFKGVVTNGGAWLFNTAGASITQGHIYFCALRAKITDYITPETEFSFVGKAGVGMANPGTGNLPVFYSCKTGDYINLAGVVMAVQSNESKQISFGQLITTFGEENITAHYTDVMVLDLTVIFGDNIPTEKELYDFYNEYVSIYTRVFDKPKQVDYYINERDAKRAFIGEMNGWASELGCSSTTVFNNPSGVYDSTPPDPDNVNNFTTAADFIRIVSAYSTHAQLLRLNNYVSYDVTINHADGTSHVVEVKSPSNQTTGGASELTSYYTVIGGKGGSWSSQTSTLGVLAKSNVNDKWLVGYLRDGAGGSGDSHNKYAMMKKLFDWAETGNAPASIPWTQAAVCYVPSVNPQGCKNIDYMLYGTNETAKIVPASTTKLLTCMIVLDNLNLCDMLEVKEQDMTIGSGIEYPIGDNQNQGILVGDKMTVRDAIIACMYASDNTLATALARMAGERMVGHKGM